MADEAIGMRRFEYRTEILDDDWEDSMQAEEEICPTPGEKLNLLGKEGWELVSVVWESDVECPIAYLKREIL